MSNESPFNKIPSQLDQIPEGVPVVFISYSWDNETHKQWVLNLSKDLREKFRVYTLLDRYNRGGEDDFYTKFFTTANMEKDNWEPLKQGLFGGKYSDYAKVYEDSEAFFRQNMTY